MRITTAREYETWRETGQERVLRGGSRRVGTQQDSRAVSVEPWLFRRLDRPILTGNRQRHQGPRQQVAAHQAPVAALDPLQSRGGEVGHQTHLIRSAGRRAVAERLLMTPTRSAVIVSNW